MVGTVIRVKGGHHVGTDCQYHNIAPPPVAESGAYRLYRRS